MNTKSILTKSLTFSDKFEKMLSGLDKNEKIEFYKKYMTTVGKTGGKVYEYIDYDGMSDEIVNFRMVYHIMEGEGEGVFDEFLFNKNTPESLKEKLGGDIEDSQIADLILEYNIHDEKIRDIFKEYIGKERLGMIVDKFIK